MWCGVLHCGAGALQALPVPAGYCCILKMDVCNVILFIRSSGILHLCLGRSYKSLTLTLFRLGVGHIVPSPYRFLPCYAKTVCNRLMKLSDF